MWSSQSPKLLHISPWWLVITDHQKKVPLPALYIPLQHSPALCTTLQVTYTEIMIASLGSLSYAEDDNRHILGIKTTQPATPSGSTLNSGGAALQDTEAKFCCHVLECDSEVMSNSYILRCAYQYV